ncbi:acyl carrier protein [Streptomyces polygonati]|uniref:Acyl carrier protein n=1 Tax=Streptomyces polygonati TaxID=1617087 RepID=A0ABV8HL25_9ACTN
MRTMPEETEAVAELRDLPRSERREALSELVVAEFRTTLSMAETEPFNGDSSYFELGFTSLLILEIKNRLEAVLGHPISANVLFNRPTVDSLLDHLTGDVLIDLFAPPTRSAAITGIQGKEAGQ